MGVIVDVVVSSALTKLSRHASAPLCNYHDAARYVCQALQPGDPPVKWLGVVMLDRHQFWFRGFIEYDQAVKRVAEIAATFAKNLRQHQQQSSHAAPAAANNDANGKPSAPPMPANFLR